MTEKERFWLNFSESKIEIMKRFTFEAHDQFSWGGSGGGQTSGGLGGMEISQVKRGVGGLIY